MQINFNYKNLLLKNLNFGKNKKFLIYLIIIIF